MEPPKKPVPGLSGQGGFGPRAPAADPVQLATSAFAKGRFDEALRIVEAASVSHHPDPEIWHLRAVFLFKAQRLKESVEAFEEACRRHPGHLPTLISFGNAALKMGRPDRAIEIFDHALTHDPGSRDAAFGKAQSNLVLGRHGDAAVLFQDMLRTGPKETRCWFSLGRSLDHLGRLSEALDAFERALEYGVPDRPATNCSLASLLVRLGRLDEALERVEAVLAEAPDNRQALSIKVVALGRSGETGKARALMGIDDLVAAKSLPVPPGHPDLDGFNLALVAAVKAHPTLAGSRPDMPMSHGRKTGNLLASDGPAFNALRSGLVGVLEDHISAMKLQGHPYLAAMPEQWRLSLWANVLDREGEIGAHIHPAAWFSGAYYAATPDFASDPVTKAGWIEVGRPRDDLAGPDWQVSKYFEARTGHLVLFPSYVYHRTVPFEGPGQRVSFGFDILPL